MAAVSLKLKEFRGLLDNMLRKQSRGNVVTDEMFNTLINAAQSEYMDIEKGKADINSDLTGELKPFYAEAIGISIAGGQYTLQNYAKILRVNTLYNDRYVLCDLVTSLEAETRLGNSLTWPTLKNPFVEEMADYLLFYPATITTANIKYIREPNEAFLDYYYDINGSIIYMDEGATHTLYSGEEYRDGTTTGTISSQTQEFEWGVSDIMHIFDIVLRMCSVATDRQLSYAMTNQDTTRKEQSV